MHDTFTDEKTFREQAAKDGVTHISTGVAVLREGNILMVRRATGDYLGGSYELPGGGVDEGESIVEGAIREVKEETGLTVSKVLGTFDGFDYSTDRKPSVRQVNFLVAVEPGTPRLDPNEHDEWQWVDENSMATVDMTDKMHQCMVDALTLARNL